MPRLLLMALSAVACALLLALSGAAHAAGTAAQICAGAKQKAAGTAAGASLSCHAKATQKGIAVDPACLAKADSKLSKAFAKAEARGGCATPGDVGAVDALLGSSVGAFVAALRPGSSLGAFVAANRCAGAKLKATGKKAKAKLACHAKATGRGLAVDPGCLAKAEVRFTTAFAQAEARPPCLTTGDAATIESLLDALVAAAVVGSPPPGTTTTTNPPSVTTTTTTTTTTPSFCAPVAPNPFPMCGGSCDGAGWPAVCALSRVITQSGPTDLCACVPLGLVPCNPPCPCPAGQICQLDYRNPSFPVCGCVPLCC
jgi:hypothetical protein